MMRDLKDVWWAVWYGAGARFHWIFHRFANPDHEMAWRDGPSDCPGGSGDAVCKTCDCCFWCRAMDWQNFVGRWMCGKEGHVATPKDGWLHVDAETGAETPCEAPMPNLCWRCGKVLE